MNKIQKKTRNLILNFDPFVPEIELICSSLVAGTIICGSSSPAQIKILIKTSIIV